MFKCPKCGSKDVDHCYSTDEIEIWCKDCGEYKWYIIPTPFEAFPNWVDEEDDEDEE